MAEYINRERARFEAKRYFKNMDEIQEDLDMLFCMLPAENVAPVQEWISVEDRLPRKEEYTATTEYGTEYYIRLLIAYKTDTVEYEIGYYDGYKWMTEMPIRLIKDVVAWMPFPNMPQPPKEAEELKRDE